MPTRTATSEIAPRLHHRRLVRIYVFPWVLLVGAIIQALISLHIGTNKWWIALFWSILSICFILKDFASPQSLITRYYYRLAQLAGFDTQYDINLAEETVVYSDYHHPPLFAHRRYARWILYLFILIVLNLYAIYQSQFPTNAPTIQRGIATFLIILYSLLIFSRFVSLPVDLSHPYRIVVWTTLVIWNTLSFSICLSNLITDKPLIINAALLLLLIFIPMFTSQRLMADRYILKDILDALIRDMLTWPQTYENLNGAAGRIGLDLRYDRVFILVADDKNSQLIITDQFAVHQSVFDQRIPLENSICGRAFREKKHVLWNDVHKCPY